MVEINKIMCPFCEKETLDVIITKRRQWSPYQGEPDKMVKSGEIFLSEKCSNCGKTIDEIKDKMKTNRTDTDNILKRLKEQNLPLEITEKMR